MGLERPRIRRNDLSGALRAFFRDESGKRAMLAELTPGQRLRSLGDLDIYSVSAHEAPHVMAEIGRVRACAFGDHGAGLGSGHDVDRFDLAENPYRQLVVWDRIEGEIVSAYRYMLCRDVAAGHAGIALATEALFTFSDCFRATYLPYTIELGRAVVNPLAKRRFVGLFAAWAGLGALIREYPDIRYFFGKVTLSGTYDTMARGALLEFLRLYCADRAGLVWPRAELVGAVDEGACAVRFHGSNYAEDYETLRCELKKRNALIPPLLISYLRLTSTMKAFGMAINRDFGNLWEIAILIAIDEIDCNTHRRFIESYEHICPGYFCSGERHAPQTRGLRTRQEAPSSEMHNECNS